MAKYKIDISPKLEFLIYFGPLSMKRIDSNPPLDGVHF